ncbi:MAG TPA: hypothetical protein PLT92_07600 [Ignavibacteriaceae bacterium]|nr:hypothetical protein [Ignavibacteriaceae bacterium]HOJ18407.1 hypothetical protein [Ignavibacteriaceae bacterium]HPO57086.1 hypothetical protein [Ignavibacteriaceae bacterium]
MNQINCSGKSGYYTYYVTTNAGFELIIQRICSNSPFTPTYYTYYAKIDENSYSIEGGSKEE